MDSYLFFMSDEFVFVFLTDKFVFVLLVPQERFSCLNCGKPFAMKSDLNRHVRTCVQGFQFQCKCGKLLRTAEGLGEEREGKGREREREGERGSGFVD